MATIFGTEGDDDLINEGDGDIIFGFGGNDRIELFGFSGNIADGGAGNDRFEIRYGDSHILTGGSGIDTYVPEFMDFTTESYVTDFAPGPGGDIIDLSVVIDIIGGYGFSGGNPFGRRIFVWEQVGSDAYLSYDEFWFLPNNKGATFAQVLVLENTSIMQLSAAGMGGYDPLPIQAYGNKIKGSGSGEDLFGTAGADGIQGLGGNDRLFGEAGDDILLGGAGDDFIVDDGGLFAPFSNDRLEGGEGNDFLYDLGGINVVAGGNGNDTIHVEAGSRNIVEGNAGNDAITVIESPGARVWGGNGNDIIIIRGTDGAIIDGGAGKDEIQGSDGEDVISGGGGADELTGDKGAFGDGIAHADRFVLTSAADSGLGRNSDLIIDFDPGVDVLDLSAIDADTATPGDDAFEFIGSAAFTAAGQLRLAPSVFANQFELLGNINGDLGADFRVVFFASAPLGTDIIG